MPAYIIVDVAIKDPEKYEAYKKLTPGTLRKFQGKFAARGGKTVSLEGGWEPGRIVILEFPTMNLATAWWNSEEYAPAKKLRQEASHTRMIAVEGFTP